MLMLFHYGIGLLFGSTRLLESASFSFILTTIFWFLDMEIIKGALRRQGIDQPTYEELRPDHAVEVKTDMSLKGIADLLLSAEDIKKLKLKQQSATNLTFHQGNVMRDGYTLRKQKITFDRLDDQTVRIRSRPRYRIWLMDYGASLTNVRQIEELITQAESMAEIR